MIFTLVLLYASNVDGPILANLKSNLNEVYFLNKLYIVIYSKQNSRLAKNRTLYNRG